MSFHYSHHLVGERGGMANPSNDREPTDADETNGFVWITESDLVEP